MRAGSPALIDALSGSFNVVTTADFFRGSDPIMQGLNFVDWEVRHDLSSTVKGSGTGTLIIPSIAGESYIPSGSSGLFSPFGTSIVITQRFSAGSFSELVLIGWFKIVRLVDARDSTAVVNGREVTTNTTLTFEFRSLDERVLRAGFPSPQQPPALGSCYVELRRIGMLPVDQSVTDRGLPEGLTWVAERGGRLAAVQELASGLGGVAVVTSDGRWRIAPHEGDVVATLHLGAHGTVMAIGHEIDTDGVYSDVFGVFEAEDGKPIYAHAGVTDGPLAIERNIRYAAAGWVNTQELADSHVQGVFAESLRSQYTDRRVSCVLNPLIEIGDFVAVDGWHRPLLGQVRSITNADDAVMDFVIRERVTL